ncbi:hypothetical protein [Streptomyces marincola]|nr:hypothetical protein [Streptomyces marincola]UCM87479.1 hypothetical protein LC193_05700 [Streptomyces marincola]
MTVRCLLDKSALAHRTKPEPPPPSTDGNAPAGDGRHRGDDEDGTER